MMSLQPKTIDFNGSCWIAISDYSKKAADIRRLTKKVASLTSRCKELESRLNDWDNPSERSANSVQLGQGGSGITGTNYQDYVENGVTKLRRRRSPRCVISKLNQKIEAMNSEYSRIRSLFAD